MKSTDLTVYIARMENVLVKLMIYSHAVKIMDHVFLDSNRHVIVVTMIFISSVANAWNLIKNIFRIGDKN